jgi:hypothetical protein
MILLIPVGYNYTIYVPVVYMARDVIIAVNTKIVVICATICLPCFLIYS